jgi:hypothetical protein
MFEDIQATTEVLIRELTLVRLYSDKTHMEKDNKLEVTIRGYDTDGSELDLTLFKMKFDLVARARNESFSGRTEGLYIQETDSNLKFIVDGRNTGTYQLRADG